MTDAASAIEANRLPLLATTINEHLRAADAATRRGLEHAIAAGLLLIEAKNLVGQHGEWLPWLQANCRLSERRAQTFMRLARNRHRLEAVKSAETADLTIAAAEALVGKPRPERPRGLPGQLDMLGAPEMLAPSAKAAANKDEKSRLRWEITSLRSKIERLRGCQNDQPDALLRCAVARLHEHEWSVADERRRFKIIQIIEHAARLIEQLARDSRKPTGTPR
jgi:Protein of unknown function (DUF3102)